MAQDAAASGAQSDADSSPKGDQDAADAGEQPDVSKIVAARVAQQLKSLNVDELKRKAAEFDKQQTANQTETERLQSRIAALEREKSELETGRQQERLATATVREAARLGFRDPADAYRLLDINAIEFDEAGNPTNVAKLLTNLLKEKSYLSAGVVNGSADGGQQGDSTPPGKLNMNDLLRAAAKGG